MFLAVSRWTHPIAVDVPCEMPSPPTKFFFRAMQGGTCTEKTWETLYNASALIKNLVNRLCLPKTFPGVKQVCILFPQNQNWKTLSKLLLLFRVFSCKLNLHAPSLLEDASEG